MKRLLIIILFAFVFLSSCTANRNRTDLKRLTYQTIDYMGGITVDNIIDFEKNEYQRLIYYPVREETILLSYKTFTDEEEDAFIKGIKKAGLFRIRKKYQAIGILDGGGWNLEVVYSDNSYFSSTGSNASPRLIFNKCSTYFYDLCGEIVLGNLPAYYKDPPRIESSLIIKTGEKDVIKAGGSPQVLLGNYKWNKSTQSDVSYFDSTLPKKYRYFDENSSYELLLRTSHYDCKKKFNKIIIKSYDLNLKEKSEEIVYDGGWFEDLKIELEFNKLYIYLLEFSDEDFVEYYFYTSLKD